MPDSPYTVPPVADGQELLNIIRDSLRANVTRAIDGLNGPEQGGLHPVDALTLIQTDLEHTLAVVKASKDTI